MVSKVNNQGLIKSRKTLNMMEQRFMNVDNEKKKILSNMASSEGLEISYLCSQRSHFN